LYSFFENYSQGMAPNTHRALTPPVKVADES
jgi:hypothetical protein